MSDLGRVVRSYIARKADGGAAFGTTTPQEDAERPPSIVEKLLGATARGIATLPRRAIENSQNSLDTGTYDPSVPMEGAMLTLGTGAGARGGLRPVAPATKLPTHDEAIASRAPAAPEAAPGTEAGLDVGRGVDEPSGGAESLRQARASAERRASGRQALEGLPTDAQIVGGEPFVPGPVGSAHDVAERYMANRETPSYHRPPEKYHDINKEHSAAIARAYEEMPHAPNDPAVKASYEALIRESLAQYRAIKESGLKITPVGAGEYPYHGNPRAVAKDVADNNHMAFFKTSEGFGSDGLPPDPHHPMMQPSGEKIGDHDMLNNDIFRVVHDYFGHIKNGYGFRATGEDNAWRAHAAMYSDLARPAMTSETRGQNSWVNYGPHGEANRTASGADTIYADQKVGLMPEWTMRDRGSPEPIIAYHGSPYSFDKFDPNKVGAGEGAQSYGHGLYFAGHSPVSEWYRHQLAARRDPLLGKYGLDSEDGANLGMRLANKKGDTAPVIESIKNEIANLQSQGESKAVKNMIARREGMLNFLKDPDRNPGHTYQVAIDHPPEAFLDYDKPMSGQSPEVQEKLRAMRGYEGHKELVESGLPMGNKLRLGHLPGSYSPEGASQALKEAGVPGIRYLDQGSRQIDAPAHLVSRMENINARMDALRATPAEKHSLKNLNEYDSLHKQKTDLQQEIKKYREANSTHNYVTFDAPRLLKRYSAGGKVAKRRRYAEGGDVNADDMIQEARLQLAGQPKRRVVEDIGDPLVGDGGEFSPGTRAGNKAADIGSKLAAAAAHGLISLPRRAIENSQHSLDSGTYDPSTSVEAAMLPMGTGAVAGVPVKGAEAVLGSGPVRTSRLVDDADIARVPSKLPVTSPREPVPVPVNSLIPSEKNLQWMKKYEKLDNEAGRETTVDSVRGALQRGEPIPPITVDADRNIVDGHHRWLAYKAEGKQEINAVVRPGEDDFVPPKGARYYEGSPEAQNAGVDARPNKSIQTVADPYRMMFPGVYRNPKLIAEEAASRVGAEDPALKRLFGVTRGDLREMAEGRVGNEEPNLRLRPNPRGALSAQNIQTPKNTQRLVDILDEAGKHEGLRTADAWYIHDPMFRRMEQMFGPEEAARRYQHLNTTTAMASPGSDVMTEIQRGTGAHWLQNQGRFDDFKKYSGLTGQARQSLKVPADIRYIQGHPYHPTSQAAPMQKYFDSGSIQSEKPKVPLYAHASGVPETGFQTSGPVGDAHFSRGVGLSDTRQGPSNVGSSFSRAEYQTLQPWWQHEVAGKVGLDSVPAQARLWTALGPQTGVESALGAPKLELFAKQIMRAAHRLKVSPETARDMILSGKAGAGVMAGAALAPSLLSGDQDEGSMATRASGGRVRYYARGGAPEGIPDDEDKPPFDPSQPFQPAGAVASTAPTAAAVKPPFDPSKPFKPAAAATPPAKTTTSTTPPGPMSADDVISGAIENAPSSAWQFAKDTVHPFVHPIETATNLKDLGLGLLEKTGAIGTILPGAGGGHEQHADAMIAYLKKRYGGVEEAKQSFAKDPVGVLSDLSMVLTGGGTASARLPSILGKTGEVVSRVGRAIDPLMAPVNATKLGTKAVGELMTHTGAPALENAYKAGVEGGEAGEVFRDNMRGHVPVGDVVDTARQGVSSLAKQRSQSYVRDMEALGKRPEIMDWDKVTAALQKNATVKNFHGVDISPETAATRNKIRDAIDKWGELPPETYHTAAGFDALKQMIGEMRDAEPYGTPGRNVADRAYHAIREEIIKQVPEYGKTMKAYERASDLIKEMNKTLSLTPGANIDTSMRKLQSIMRNNVNTNYGRRLELGKLLEENGATHLMAALSGQSLNSWAPRGLGRYVAGSTLPAIGAGLASGHIVSAIGAGLALPLMSPRLMGEVSHFAGRTGGRFLDRMNGVGLGNRATGNISYRLGRATNPYENTETPPNPYAP